MQLGHSSFCAMPVPCLPPCPVVRPSGPTSSSSSSAASMAALRALLSLRLKLVVRAGPSSSPSSARLASDVREFGIGRGAWRPLVLAAACSADAVDMEVDLRLCGGGVGLTFVGAAAAASGVAMTSV